MNLSQKKIWKWEIDKIDGIISDRRFWHIVILGLVHTSYLVEEMDGTLEIVHYGEEGTFPSSGKTSQCLLKSEGGKYSTLSNRNTFPAPTLVK